MYRLQDSVAFSPSLQIVGQNQYLNISQIWLIIIIILDCCGAYAPQGLVNVCGDGCGFGRDAIDIFVQPFQQISKEFLSILLTEIFYILLSSFLAAAAG